MSLNKELSRIPIDWVNVFAVITPIIIVGGGLFFSYSIDNIDKNIQYISFLASVIFGISFANAIRHILLSKSFLLFSQSQNDFISKVENEIDFNKRSNTILSMISNNSDFDSLEQYAKWLNANRQFGSEIPQLSDLCNWQRSEVNKFLADKAGECKEHELVIDNAVKELVTNTTLLTDVPKKTVIAVSFEDTVFWKSEEGLRFLDAHKSVINKGVEITRIFVIQGGERKDLEIVMNAQCGIGINVYEVEYSKVKILKPQDCVIYDNVLVRRGYNNANLQNDLFKMAKLLATPSVIISELDKAQALIAVSKKWEVCADD